MVLAIFIWAVRSAETAGPILWVCMFCLAPRKTRLCAPLGVVVMHLADSHCNTCRRWGCLNTVFSAEGASFPLAHPPAIRILEGQRDRSARMRIVSRPASISVRRRRRRLLIFLLRRRRRRRTRRMTIRNFHRDNLRHWEENRSPTSTTICCHRSPFICRTHWCPSRFISRIPR